jgi:glutathione reductase (NADPH)
MAEQFDVVVVGSGSAAGQIASVCRTAGKSVALIDEKPFGGTCQLRGCDPKKVLVGAADVVDQARRMSGRGIAGDTRIDWPALMRFKQTFVESVPKQHAESWAKQGIEAISGTARFIGPDRITVSGRELVARKVALACGMRPATLGIPGEEWALDSEGFLNLEELPRRVVFIGGGYIAFEMGHVAARAGAEVTIVHRGTRPLEGFDPDLTDRLVKKSRELGIRVELGAAVNRIEEGRVYAGDRTFPADLVVHAAGRVPNLDSLDLKAGSVEAGPHGVKVDRYLRSVSNDRVFAAGDCADTGLPALTPVAGYLGRLAAANILGSDLKAVEKLAIPSVVFSLPPLARVGLLEAEAKRQGLDFDVHSADSSGWYSSRRVSEDCSGSKVLIERGTGKVLGAHLLGHGCEGAANLLALAMQEGIPAERILQVLYAYPTSESDLQYRMN